MKRIGHGGHWSLALLALIAAVAMIPSGTAQAQTMRALIIGIDRYNYPSDTATRWRRAAAPAVAAWRESLAGKPGAVVPAVGMTAANVRENVANLKGAVNDATAMSTVLRARYGFTDIRVLANAQATRAGILAAIEQLTAASQRGDVVAFFYAGHGSQRVNSLAENKLNRLDQTIVPADVNSGAFDLRNMELNAAFGRLIDKGVILTLIFDSCHSGSITRGETAPGLKRWAAADPRDAYDSVRVPSPETRGAMLLAAAQDFQLAEEIVDPFDQQPHGAFTSALLHVMRQVPVSEPAVQVFARTKAILREAGQTQDPVMRGATDDRARILFGLGSGALAGRVALTLLHPEGDTLHLQGGLALGIGVGTELHLVDSVGAPKETRIRITDVPGLGSSSAVVIAGPKKGLRAGDLFVIDRWIESERPALRTWIPAPLAAPALQRAATDLGALRTSKAIEWVDDPRSLPDDSTRALYVVRHATAGWQLVAPTGESKTLSSATALVVEQAVAAEEALAAKRASAAALSMHRSVGTPRGRPLVFVNLPPTPGLRGKIRLGSGTENEAIAVIADPRGADFTLIGHDSGGTVSYAWLRPNARGNAADVTSLPVRTDWFASTGMSDSVAADSVTGAAIRLARVVGWLSVAPPAESVPYPYKMSLRNVETNGINDSGVTRGGERYEFVLRRDPSVRPPDIPVRWVYIFAIDSWGKSAPLWDAGNTIPYDSAGVKNAPLEIVLRHSAPIRIGKPFGTDTFIMVTSDEQLDPEIFRFAGVVSRGPGLDRGASGLAGLFSHVTGVTRGWGDPVPTDWSIQRVVLKSIDPTAR